MEWKVIITSALTSGVVTVMINSFIKGGISHYYNKKLKRFETDLSVMSEEKRLDFQRKLHDFGLYSSKRHEIYPMLYKYLIEASTVVSYALAIKKYAPDMIFADEKTLLLFKEQNDHGSKEENLDKALVTREIEATKEAVFSAEKVLDFFRESELFLSENVAKQGIEIVMNLAAVAKEIHLKTLIDHGIDFVELFGLNKMQLRDYSVIRNEIDEINTRISRLKALMKNELGIGDYE
jgi:hypothetical protein